MCDNMALNEPSSPYFIMLGTTSDGEQKIYETTEQPEQESLQWSNGLCTTEAANNTMPNACSACGGSLAADKYIMAIDNRFYHDSCLECVKCQQRLTTSCYWKMQALYCKSCYSIEFAVHCARCDRPIAATDWVRRAKKLTYHLACFACDICKRQLSTGESFALQYDTKILCKQHYLELVEGESATSKNGKSKRVRTTFTDEQLAILQRNFAVDSNPDGQDLERIAQMTGLSKRVTQVWFQNSRARQKKYSKPSDMPLDSMSVIYTSPTTQNHSTDSAMSQNEYQRVYSDDEASHQSTQQAAIYAESTAMIFQPEN